MNNILQIQDSLKGLPDSALMKEMQSPSGVAPQFLVLSELSRRQQMRKAFPGAQPHSTVASDVLSGVGGGPNPQLPGGAPHPGMPGMPNPSAPGIASGLPPAMQGQQMPMMQNPGLARPQMARGGMVRHYAEGDEVSDEDFWNARNQSPSAGASILNWIRSHRGEAPPGATSPEALYGLPPGTPASPPPAPPAAAAPPPTGHLTGSGMQYSIGPGGKPTAIQDDMGTQMPSMSGGIKDVDPSLGTPIAPVEGIDQLLSYLQKSKPAEVPASPDYNAILAKVSQGNQTSPVTSKINDALAGLNSQKKNDVWQAIAEAGFGIAAGKSPYALQNIGEGGLAGLKSYAQLHQNTQAEQLKALGLQGTMEDAQLGREQQARGTAATLFDAGQQQRRQAQQFNAQLPVMQANAIAMGQYRNALANAAGSRSNLYDARAAGIPTEDLIRSYSALQRQQKDWSTNPANFGKPFPAQAQLDAMQQKLMAANNLGGAPQQQADPLGIR